MKEVIFGQEDSLRCKLIRTWEADDKYWALILLASDKIQTVNLLPHVYEEIGAFKGQDQWLDLRGKALYLMKDHNGFEQFFPVCSAEVGDKKINSLGGFNVEMILLRFSAYAYDVVPNGSLAEFLESLACEDSQKLDYFVPTKTKN